MECPLHDMFWPSREPYHSSKIPTSMSESLLRVIVLLSLVYPSFKLDNEQDEICKALLIKQETKGIE